MKKFLYGFCFWTIILGIIFISIKHKSITKNQNTSFVRVENGKLYLKDNVYRSIGVNRYNLLAYDETTHCANSFSEEDINTMFSNLHNFGITTVRFWFFQSFTHSGKDLERFNYVLKKAKQYNIRLIPVFENHWHDCTQGEMKPEWWYQSGYLNPYGTYALSLKQYIEKVVPLYKNDSTILAWQVMNEAESSEPENFYNFAKDITVLIKSLDPNHLVSFGTSGTKQETNEYRKLHMLTSIDFLTYHDYAELDFPIPNDLRNRFEDSQVLNKPIIVGEAGADENITNRAELLEAKMKAFFENGGSAYLIWSYGEKSTTDDGNNFDSQDPLANVIKNITSELNIN